MKTLRKVLRIGNTRAITIPPAWIGDGIKYVWVEKQGAMVIIRPAEVS